MWECKLGGGVPFPHVENDDFAEEELARIPFDLRMANLTLEAQRGAMLGHRLLDGLLVLIYEKMTTVKRQSYL